MQAFSSYPSPGARLLPVICSLMAPCFSLAAPLYSESFESEATAKVRVNKQANSSVTYVDYSSFVRDEAGGGGPVTVSIPEAPNRIAGSAPTRGVVLNSTYGGSARLVNLLAATAAGGPAAGFSGNYRVSCDMWLSIDTTTTVGTTEVGIFGIGHSGSALVGYSTRTSGVGTFGWISGDGDINAATGDVTIFNGNAAAFRKDGVDSLFGLAFPQGRVKPLMPNNQWTQIELIVVGTKATLLLNGVKFGDAEPAITSGFATIGYEDFAPGSASGGRNLQFGLFDNFVVESITGAPVLEAMPYRTLPPVTVAGDLQYAEFHVSNLDGASEYSITGAAITGVHASDFTLTSAVPSITSPVIIAPLEHAAVEVEFAPQAPNGLKVALLTLTTTDPARPVIHLPLQGRRTVNSIEGAVSTRVASVTTAGGSGAGEIKITNNSAVPVSLNSVTATGVDAAMFAASVTFPLEIASGEFAFVPVTFTPTGTAGLKTATLNFATTDPSVPVLGIVTSSRYGFGPPLLAHFKMNEASGPLIDAAGVSAQAGVTATLDYSQPSLLPGGAGSAVRFNSLNNNSFAVSQTVHLPDVSYSLWIKPEPKASATNRTLLHRASAYGTTAGIYALYLTPGGQLVLEINSTRVAASEDGVIHDGTVYHVGVTHRDEDGFGNTTATRTRLYLDGVLVAESAPEPPELAVGYTDYNLNAPGIGLYIGHTNGGGDTGYTGLMDDLQIYTYELTAGEIAGLYSQPGKTVAELQPLDYRITSVQYDPVSGSVSLTWNSVPGATYAVQQSTTTEGFTDVPGQASILSGGVTSTVTFTSAGGPRRFFLIRRLP